MELQLLKHQIKTIKCLKIQKKYESLSMYGITMILEKIKNLDLLKINWILKKYV